jgi:GT2 family glycosyltransferase
LTIQTGTINRSGSNKVDPNSSLRHLPRAAEWHYPSFLWRVLPSAVKNALREMRVRILTLYLTRHLPRNKEFEQSPEDALATASLSIIVPVHDAPEVTRRCLMSLQKYAPKAEIILVDDASKLEETSAILEDFSSRNGWKLIRHLEPLGHSLACDAGASLATRPYLCLLNSDTVVTPWCWRLITRVFEDNPNIGVAGPSSSSAGSTQTLPLAHFARFYMNDSQICEYASRLLAEHPDTIITDLSWVCGFAFFIRRCTWEQLGGFDRNIPDYGNEVELCRRLLGIGYRAVWVRNSYIHHFGGASYDKPIGVKSIFVRARAAEDYMNQK